MGAKFGVTIGFCIVYIAHTSLFPVMFAATSMGFCNVLARAVSIASPLVAQMEQPLPMICFSVSNIICGILATFLVVDDPVKAEQTEKKWRKW